MRLTVAAIAACAIAARSRPALAEGPFFNGPYLQHVSSASADIRVELDPPGPATVEVSAGDGPEITKRTLTTAQTVRGVVTFHVDGLLPATRYRYVVHAGSVSAPAGELVTAPKDETLAPFAFVVYGDTRSNERVHAAVVGAIQKEAFEFLVNTGDYVVAGGERALWHEFFSIEKDLLRDHCVFACIGNHELAEDQAASNYLAYLGPNETGSAVPYGTFRWGRARFFLLNAFQDWGQGELSWLQRELDKADSEPNLTWRIVVVHHSPWSSGRHGNDAKMLEAGVPELLVRHHVDLVFAGHDHIYERGESKGLKYMISGGGGAPLYTERIEAAPTRHFEAAYNFVRVSFEGELARTVAKRVDGSLIETCGFKRGDSWNCDPKETPSTSPATTQASTTPSSAPGIKPTASPCGCRIPGPPTNEGPFALGLAALATAFIRSRGSRRRAARSPLA
jgi:acid phosphatase type 7